MTFRLGLTGGIGMGKSTAAAMFAELGHPVWDADAAVHRLYAPGGAAVGPVAAAFSSALVDGGIDRAALKTALAADPGALRRLEAIVHPLLRQDRADFLTEYRDAPIAIFDIPLLFETGADAEMDGSATVSTDPATQRARMLARPGVGEGVLDLILSRQLDDATRRARADWIIPSDTLEGARAAVRAICEEILDA